MIEAMLDELLIGAIDMHVHSSPDITPRKLSDLQVAQAAEKAGLAGVLLKCHYGSTAARASLAGQCTGTVRVFGGLVLNRPVGGLNPAAVETEIALGAKEIWLPTISAANHLAFLHQSLAAAVPVTDDSERLLPAVYEILELIAKADVILGTGHLNTEECLKVIAAAQGVGVRKILVTHPEWEVTAMPLEVQKHLSAQGVMFERCFYASNSAQQLPVVEVIRQVREVGAATTVLSSDFGQVSNDEPVIGFRRFLQAMTEGGITKREIESMIKENPSGLLGL